MLVQHALSVVLSFPLAVWQECISLAGTACTPAVFNVCCCRPTAHLTPVPCKLDVCFMLLTLLLAPACLIPPPPRAHIAMCHTSQL
jgi:hypothetical protein